MQSLDLFDDGAWDWGGVARTRATCAGRECLRLAGDLTTILARGVELSDGVIELDLAMTAERSFHGINWRIRGDDCEAFWVRPHQVGNPDAIQYTPVTNGQSSWQLFTGEGFWHPTEFPIGGWFTIRVAFAGDRLQGHVAGELVLPCTRLRHGASSGGLGISFTGGTLHVGGLRYSDEAPVLPDLPAEPRVPGAIERWEVSEAFAEAEIGSYAARSWTRLEAEPSGLLDLARVNALTEAKNTVYARATIASDEAHRAPLELGFSDRAIVFLNGERLFRGSDGYRARDYRFLGSIGWFDTVYLPLVVGDNELVVAVAEDFGGWGLQARLAEQPR